MSLTVHPRWAIPGSPILMQGATFTLPADRPPAVRVGSETAHVVGASRDRLRVIVPVTSEGGTATIQIEGVTERPSVEVAQALTTGVHQVDSPAFDARGRLFVTQSGGQGAKISVPLYRVTRDGVRDPVAVAVANPTGMALGSDGSVYISSRFEHAVYRLDANDHLEVFATDLGVPTGLAFSGDGALYVGDRTGSILRVSPGREVETFATLPPSVAAFHLAFGPDQCLYVSAPTLSSRDAIYRITPDRLVDTISHGFGRPQGLAFDSQGDLYVVEALAGSAGLYRIDVSAPGSRPELVLAAPALVGVAFDPGGGAALASNDTIWRLDVALRPYLPALN